MYIYLIKVVISAYHLSNLVIHGHVSVKSFWLFDFPYPLSKEMWKTMGGQCFELQKLKTDLSRPSKARKNLSQSYEARERF